jgi:hypothetical protein
VAPRPSIYQPFGTNAYPEHFSRRGNRAFVLTLRQCSNDPFVELDMDSIIYLVGLIVIVMFILGALGLR